MKIMEELGITDIENIAKKKKDIKERYKTDEDFKKKLDTKYVNIQRNYEFFINSRKNGIGFEDYMYINRMMPLYEVFKIIYKDKH